METEIHNLIDTERVDPKRRFFGSDGALYVVLLVLVVLVITAGNVLSARWNLPRAYVQISMYVVLIVLAWAVVRFCLTSFRYTLTDRILSVERIVGRKSKADDWTRLSDIIAIEPFDTTHSYDKKRAVYVGRKRDSLAVRIRDSKGERTLLISPSAGFIEKLTTQWKIARK